MSHTYIFVHQLPLLVFKSLRVPSDKVKDGLGTVTGSTEGFSSLSQTGG